MVYESRVTWATSVPILVFLGLSILDLGPMYATDRQTDVRRQTPSSLNAPWTGHNKTQAIEVALIDYTIHDKRPQKK